MAGSVQERHGSRVGARDALGDAGSVSRWRRFPAPCLRGDPARLVDEVVVGPSGVHVVMHTDVMGTTTADTTTVHACAATASRAAEAVADLLPPRYRGAVRPLVCACRVRGTGRVVGAVPVLAAEACRHTLEHAPRVLSTSEVQRVSGLLDAVLAPEPGARAPRTSRRLLWWSAGGATAAGLAAVGGATAAVGGVAAALSQAAAAVGALPW